MNAQSATLSFQSKEEQTSLLELYTSEGCSSCPPAEAWLSRLADAPGLWKDFVPVAFHVDYWDYLGWRDPWSSRQNSERQRTYAQAWHSGSVYSPGFVLNGKEWRAWSRNAGAPELSGLKVGVLKIVSTDTNHWRVMFTPVTPAAKKNYTFHGALLAGHLISNVKAGENRGRQLTHDFVVLSLASGVLSPQNGLFAGEFVLDAAKKPAPGRLAVAVWVSRQPQLDPLQATGGWVTGMVPASD